jgi:hypothetical protein
MSSKRVAAKPSLLVTAAMAGMTISGSLLGICIPSVTEVSCPPRNVS